MIELIYNEEENTVTQEKTLPEPKNVKQIGEPRENKKIFLEDYVHTFLKQYSKDGEQKVRMAILLGKSEHSGGKRHLYIKSALPITGVTEKQGKYSFTEKIWGDIYLECEQYFPKQEILGWFLSKPGFSVEKTMVTEETHRTYFSGPDKMFFQVEPLEGESAFFGFDGNRFAKQSGYYIYYEKNEPMREFLLEKNRRQKAVSNNEKPDVAMVNFRKILKEKQVRNEKRKKRAFSYGTKAAAAAALFFVAVAVGRQISPAEETVKEEAVLETSGSEVVVEDLLGDVAAQQEEIKDFMIEEELPVAEEVIEEITAEQPEEAPDADVKVYQEYIVQPGDTLAKISKDFYGDISKVSEICTMNGISDGDYIQAGEIILLP